VGRWITHNEPWVASFLGYLEGVFAPGVTGWDHALTVAHHILVSHGRACAAIRAALPGAQVGLALDCRPSYPTGEDAVEAQIRFDGYRNRWFFDPVFAKGYPEDMIEIYTSLGRWDPSLVRPGDMEEIGAPIDFLGLNYYTTMPVGPEVAETEVSEGPMGPNPPAGFTEMGWRTDPAGLTGFLDRLAIDYGPPSILITEYGASYSDGPGPDGRVHDARRIDYLDTHISASLDAEAPVDGYFVWSFMDNLEWVQGFSQRFGLVWVDHSTGSRTPKDSYFWYRDRIREGTGRGPS